MPSRIFRFYSLEPRIVFEMAAERSRSALVRRGAWKIGGSPVWYTTIVLDEPEPAVELERWLARNAPVRDIRAYVGRAGRSDAGAAFEDVQFHRGGYAARLKFAIHMCLQAIGPVWPGVSARLARLKI